MPEIDDEYIDPIALKKVCEMTDPMISPHTGHVYDKADIVQWITLKGTDPIAKDKPLTATMLVSGFAVKKLAKKNNDDIADIKKDMAAMKEMFASVLQENIQLKKESVKTVWALHGNDIDKKLKKGSTPVRTKALQDYKDKVLKSADDTQLKTAVQDTAHLKSKAISERRWFTMFGGTGDTTRVAVEFQDKVNFVKGWGN